MTMKKWQYQWFPNVYLRESSNGICVKKIINRLLLIIMTLIPIIMYQPKNF